MSAANVSKIEQHGEHSYSCKCLLCKQGFAGLDETDILTVVQIHFDERHEGIVPLYGTFEAKE